MKKKNKKAKSVVKTFLTEKKIPSDIKTCLVLFWSQFQSKNNKVRDIQPINFIPATREYKINLLKAMSSVILSRPDYITRKRRRNGFNERRDNPNRHHIIQLQHGGRNIPNNIVHLCRSCHKEIHK